MARYLRRHGPLAILILIVGSILYWHFSAFFACPSCYLFVDSADGLKNYFTPAYFVVHDPGLWFNGMNYPYGEHIVYTDNQPAWSLTMKLIDRVFPMAEHVIGTLNMLMILSLLLCALCLYGIFRAFSLPGWYAAMLAIPITLLSPQILRIHGHYSLAYAFYLPLFLLLFVRFLQSDRRVLPGMLCAVWIVWMGFTHLYFMFIACLFLLSYAFVRLCINGFRLQSKVITTVGIALIAGGIVYGTVKITDPVEDRPREVYGLYVYAAKAEGTFLPWREPFSTFWKDKLNIRKPDFEALSYVGLPVTILLIPVLVWLSFLAFKRTRRNRTVHRVSEIWIFLLAAVPVWLLASSWLYSLGVEYLTDVFPALGQFRSLGRLAWIFYYVAGIAVAYWAYLIIRMSSGIRRILLTGLFAFLWALWVWEGVHFTDQYIHDEYPGNHFFKRDTPYADLLRSKDVSADTYQAILQLPMVAIGSEKLNIQRGLWYMRLSMQCAWETGLPIVNSNMSRTSVSQTLSMLQLISDPHIPKRRLDDMDNRPLLVIAGPDRSLLLQEQRLVDSAEFLGNVLDARLYTLSLDAFSTTTASKTDPPADILHLTFDESRTDHAMHGLGAFYAGHSRQEILSWPDTLQAETGVIFSCWSHLGPHSPGFPVVWHRVESGDGDVVYEKDYSMFSFNPTNVAGSWIETRFTFSARGDGSVHRFQVQPEGTWVDDVRLIQED